MADISPEDYELAVLSKVRLDFVGAYVRVEGTENGSKHYVKGRFSLVARQLDIAVYRVGEKSPFLIADAKRHGRKITVQDIEAFIGMADDVGAEISILIASDGFTASAERRAGSASMQVKIITREEALTFRWLPLAREIFPHDWGFHQTIAHAMRLFHENAPPDAVLEALEDIASEEWDACMLYILKESPSQAVQFLLNVARYHFDEGWRFNAIQHLMEADLLEEKVRQELLANENDPETIELLTN